MRKPRRDRLDLSGQKIGKITIIKDSGKINKENRILWLCKCECGKEILSITSNLRHKPHGCRNCRIYDKKSWNNSTIGELTGTFWARMLHNAKTRNINVSITKEEAWNLFLKQNKKCNLSDLLLSFGKYNKTNYVSSTASLDRIDSNKEYSLENCQWIHRVINNMKRNYSQEYFMYLCKLIINPIKNNQQYISIRKSTMGRWNSKWTGDLNKNVWYGILQGAKRRNINIEITQEQAWELFLKQNGKCVYSGLPIYFWNNYKEKRRTASLDRINNTKSYTLENVQWLHKDINYMKHVLTEKEFLNWCKLIVDHEK